MRSFNLKDEKPLLKPSPVTTLDVEEQATQVLTEDPVGEIVIPNSSIQRSHSSQDKKTSNDIKQFHMDAMEENTLLISACIYKQSGCHGFGETLKSKYPKLHHIKYFCHSGMDFKTDDKPIQKTHWKKIFYTGCAVSRKVVTKKIIMDTKQIFNIKKLEAIYYILPPHFQCQSVKASDYSVYSDTLKQTVLTTSYDAKSTESIGLPLVTSTLDSNFKLESNCYGLIYTRHAPSCIQKESLNFSINAYFSYISLINKSSISTGKPSVMLIGFQHTVYNKYAADHGIEMKFVERLPLADFKSAIKQIGVKKGAIYTDGAYTHAESILAGTLAFFYAVKHNMDYANELSRLSQLSKDSTSQYIIRSLLRNEIDNEDVTSKVNPQEYVKMMGMFKFIMLQAATKFDLDYKNCGSLKRKKPQIHSKSQSKRLKFQSTDQLIKTSATSGLFRSTSLASSELIATVEPVVKQAALTYS